MYESKDFLLMPLKNNHLLHKNKYLTRMTLWPKAFLSTQLEPLLALTNMLLSLKKIKCQLTQE